MRLARVAPGPSPPTLEHVAVVLNTTRGTRTIESQYLYIVGQRWLKVRATEPDDSAAASPVAGFARAIAGRVARTTR